MNKVRHLKPAKKRKLRIRGKIFGTADRPRLTICRSNQHIYLQVIDDDQGKTIVAASDKSLETGKKKVKGTKTEKAKLAAESLAGQLKKKKITKLAFDRGSYKYHGRVKAVAEVIRQAGVEV